MKNNRFEYIKVKSDQLLELLKSDKHSAQSSYALILLLVLFISSIILHYFKYGFSPILGVALFIIICILGAGRIVMQKSIKENIASANYDAYKDVDEVTYLRTKLQYIHSGIDIKYTRTNSIRILYVCVFPFILILIKEIFQGQIGSTGGLIGYLILALFLSSIFWWFYFGNELEKLEISKDDIKSYLEGI